MITHPRLGELRVIGMLGCGSTGEVFLAESIRFGFKVALKKIKRDCPLDCEDIVVIGVDSPLLASVYDLFEYDEDKYFLMEYVTGVSLLSHITTHGMLSEDETRTIFVQLICAIDFLHKSNIVHRDIKCENVMIDKDKNIKLIDFGLARKGREYMNTMVGSPAYLAPEIIQHKEYTDNVDIWALGIVLYVMTVGKHPFKGECVKKLMEEILNSEPVYPRTMSEELWNLLNGMLVKNPDYRFTLDQIIIHPWLQKDPTVYQIRSNEPIASQNLNPETIDVLNSTSISQMELRELLIRIFKVNSVHECPTSLNKFKCSSLYQRQKHKTNVKSFACPRKSSLINIISTNPSLLRANRGSLRHIGNRSHSKFA